MMWMARIGRQPSKDFPLSSDRGVERFTAAKEMLDPLV